MKPIKKDEKKILKLCLSSYRSSNLSKDAFVSFSKNYRMYSNTEITFRELMSSIKAPQGELKEAMQSYYDNSQYHRVFKNR